MEEKTLRREVATCCRLAEYLGLFDFSGHASARIPGAEVMFINSRNSVRSNIMLKDIIKVNVRENDVKKGPKAPQEIHIHSAIYRHRPDVNAVAHLHSPAVIALSVAGKKCLPVIQRGCHFAGGVPEYDDSRVVNSLDRGKALAKTLGQRRAVILRGHGSVVVAESVKSLLFYSLFLELNARYQLAAFQAGQQPRLLQKEAILEGNQPHGQRFFEKVWDYYVEKASAKPASRAL